MIVASELEGRDLDYWIAAAMEDATLARLRAARAGSIGKPGLVTSADPWRPSESWQACGLMIEELAMTVTSPHSPVHRNGGPHGGWGVANIWGACTWTAGKDGRRAFAHHADPRVAICRCYVAHKLGREFEA